MADKTKAEGMLAELKTGPYPSFVKEIELSAKTNKMAQDLIGLLELSYQEKLCHWKHGGIVGVVDGQLEGVGDGRQGIVRCGDLDVDDADVAVQRRAGEHPGRAHGQPRGQLLHRLKIRR